MSRRQRAPKQSSNSSRTPFVLVAVISFAMGAFATWLILGGSPGTPRSSPSPAAPSAAAAEAPPDVSQLAPVAAATALANWNYDRQNWPHAMEHYQQAISLGSDNADIRTDLGNCFRFLGQPEKALEQYQLAQRQNPQHENSLFNTAGLYGEGLHDPAKAAESWREYLRRFPAGSGAARARKFLAEGEQRESEQAAALKRLMLDDVPKP
jgi:tetratricopeptide (TPR) repeat protein